MRCLFVHAVYCFLLQGTKNKAISLDNGEDAAVDVPLVWVVDSGCKTGIDTKEVYAISKCDESECEQQCKNNAKGVAGCCELTKLAVPCSCSFFPGSSTVNDVTKSAAIYTPEPAAPEPAATPEAATPEAATPEAAKPEADEAEAAGPEPAANT